LHVGHESDSQGERIEREVQLNDFMREGAGAQAEPQNLIDRMFNGAGTILGHSPRQIRTLRESGRGNLTSSVLLGFIFKGAPDGQ